MSIGAGEVILPVIKRAAIFENCHFLADECAL
jgi:hypothetical protein